MEKIVEQSLLYDFYGDLLTDHQKDIYEGYILENLSLAELAESSGISRQGVHDLIRRVESTLSGYENKLHLVEKFLHIRQEVQKIRSSQSLDQTKEIAEEILEIL
ncbi:MAG: YlxM family DNA-binding protein [Parasporobacterium sp.]|nr:YlxM family DNA-binding protein [Parasporobacterium sp.]